MAARGAAVLACAVLLTGLLAAGSAAAQMTNADGSETLFEATLMVGQGSILGFSGALGYEGSSVRTIGSLSQTGQITYGDTTYRFDILGIIPDGCGPVGAREDELSLFTYSGGNWDLEETPSWVLQIGSHTFNFADATGGGAGIDWCGVTASDLGWSEGSTDTVKIIKLNAPSAPTNLTASAVSSARINLSWTTPATTGGADITGYRIEVSTDGGNNWADLVADTASTETMYSHKRLSSGTTRHYRVSAINAIGTGAVSNVASATTASDITTPTANADGSDTLWTATLTVGEDSGGTTGYNLSSGYGTLSSNAFTFDGSTRTIVFMHASAGSPSLQIEPKLNDFGNATLHRCRSGPRTSGAEHRRTARPDALVAAAAPIVIGQISQAHYDDFHSQGR